MRLLRGLHNPGLDAAGCVATIGNFDGVHIGHQTILERVKARADEQGLPSLVLLFEPQPLEFFRGTEAPARLMTLREKVQALTEAGIDYVCCLRFDDAFSQYSADRFVDDVLVQHLRVKHLVIGDDFRYGGDREGDFRHLRARGVELGFGVESTPTCLDDSAGQRISSTRVREVLHQGDFGMAAEMLGRPYTMSGRVVHGQALGRQLGFPTANIPLKRLRSPLGGVYAVRLCRTDGSVHEGVANVGCKPSIGQFLPNLEVHLFDFGSNLYGERVQVEFIAHLRKEQRFDGLEALQTQIKQDVQQAKACLAYDNNDKGQSIAK